MVTSSCRHQVAELRRWSPSGPGRPGGEGRPALPSQMDVSTKKQILSGERTGMDMPGADLFPRSTMTSFWPQADQEVTRLPREGGAEGGANGFIHSNSDRRMYPAARGVQEGEDGMFSWPPPPTWTPHKVMKGDRTGMSMPGAKFLRMLGLLVSRPPTGRTPYQEAKHAKSLSSDWRDRRPRAAGDEPRVQGGEGRMLPVPPLPTWTRQGSEMMMF